jgi:hypothetical protein
MRREMSNTARDAVMSPQEEQMSRSSKWRNVRFLILVGALFLALAWPGTAVWGTDSVAPAEAPASGEASLEGTVTSVRPSGQSITVGTKAFSFPDIPVPVRDNLWPGSFVHVRFSNDGEQNVVTSIAVQRYGFGSFTIWSRASGAVSPAFRFHQGRPRARG